MKFEIIKYHNKARLGKLISQHGIIETPAFVFCATKGAIKCMNTHQLSALGTQVLLTNTYHIMNGLEYITSLNGLHNFMSWNGPMFTDSGGFQIFSLGYGMISDEIKGRNRNMQKNVQINDNGAIFKSYISGKKQILTPEISVLIQKYIGSDYMMPLDICTPYRVTRDETLQSMILSHQWEQRSLEAFIENRCYENQSLYSIIQGGIYHDLRYQSVEFCEQHDFFGTAIGGSLGHNRNEMYNTIEYTMSLLQNTNRPVHLLGIGGLYDIYFGVLNGIDTFDCVHPTRMARHGAALIRKGKINILNSQYKLSEQPICTSCMCNTCQNYSLAYLHYLFKAQEMTGMIALTEHNIYFMNQYMQEIRTGIKECDIHTRLKDWLPTTLEEIKIM